MQVARKMYVVDNAKFSAAVRAKRGNRTRIEVAEELGVHHSAIARAESLKSQRLTPFFKLCAWLDIPPSNLFESASSYGNSAALDVLVLQQLAREVRRKRGDRTITTVANGSNLSPKEISMGEHANLLGMKEFVVICAWAGVQPENLFVADIETK